MAEFENLGEVLTYGNIFDYKYVTRDGEEYTIDSEINPLGGDLTVRILLSDEPARNVRLSDHLENRVVGTTVD